MIHLAVCLLDPKTNNRVGFVISADSEQKAVIFAETFRHREGYVGETDFLTAVKRAGMMERNEKGAWGPAENLDDNKTGEKYS